MRVQIRPVRRQCSSRVVIAKEGEIIMALVLVELIDIPSLGASLLSMRSIEYRSSG